VGIYNLIFLIIDRSLLLKIYINAGMIDELFLEERIRG
jgi:hypothetical protein